MYLVRIPCYLTLTIYHVICFLKDFKVSNQTDLAIVHQLSRTGGTLFAKILGNSENILLLSEVHPSRKGKDIRKQCLKFHQIAIPKSIDTYSDCISFLQENTQKDIIIRDLSHQDFLFRRSRLNVSSTRVLHTSFQLNRLAIARHPVNQFLSMMNFIPIQKYMTFQLFCRGYIAYHQSVQDVPVIRYEDIIEYPENVLKTASRVLKIEFPNSSLENFHKNTNVTGDKPENGSRGFKLRDIKNLPKRDKYEETCEKMKNIPEIQEICARLEYQL